jgi:hypothetical protein
MDAKFVNGATVTRVWSDEATELLAAFQYDTDAITFAKMKASDDSRPDSVRYHVYNHYTAKTTIIAPPKREARAA